MKTQLEPNCCTILTQLDGCQMAATRMAGIHMTAINRTGAGSIRACRYSLIPLTKPVPSDCTWLSPNVGRQAERGTSCANGAEQRRGLIDLYEGHSFSILSIEKSERS